MFGEIQNGEAKLDAIILAGGKGKRMRSVTMDQYPKGLTPINGKTILEWEIEWLSREGISHVILAIGYMADMIKDKIGNHMETSFGKVEIDYSIEKTKLGSGGAAKLASSLVVSDKCLLLNGDLLSNSSLTEMKKIHNTPNTDATMLLVKMRSPYGIVETEGNLITNFLEKPLLNVYIHGGINIFNSHVLERFPHSGQMEETIFVELAKEGKFQSFKVPESDFWMSIDGEKDYELATQNWEGI